MKKLLVLLMVWQNVLAQKIQVLVPKEPVIIGNAFQVQFILPNTLALEHIVPPVTDSIKLISGPNLYKGTTMINGKLEQVQNVAFTLVASALGNVRIKETTIAYKNGEEVRTEEAFITVMPQIKASFNSRSNFTDLNLYAPASKTDFDELIAQNLFVKTEVNKKTCYVGEPVVATFKLYSRLQSSSEVVNAPSLYGFSVMDILNTNEAHQAIETISGKVFNTSILRKLQLYPEQSGRLVIDPMELDNEIEFNDSLNENHPTIIQRSISTDPVPILVKALPRKKPQDYSGAVGRFKISAKLENKTMSTRQQGKLIVIIDGKGNFIQLGPPQINWPKEFEVFEPEVNDQLNKNLTPVEGHREYTYLFTINQEGKYSIPPIRFSYFNPASDSFSQSQTDSIQVNIVKGSRNEVPDKVEIKRRSIKQWWLVFLLILPAAAFAWLKWGKKKKEVVAIPVEKSITEKLKDLDVLGLSDKEACVQLQKLLAETESRYASLTSDQMEALRSIYSDCQLLAYSSVEEKGKKEELKKRAVRLLLEVERQKN